MSIAQGFKSKCGIGKESSWGTLVSPAELIPFKSESVKDEIEWIEDETLVGKAGKFPPEIGVLKVSGDITCELSYQDTDILLAAAFGGGGSTPSGTGPYTHIIQLSDDILRSLSFHIEKTVSVWSIAGAKINNLKISGEAGKKIELAAGIIAKDISLGTTYRTALDGLSLPSKPIVKFSHLKFLVGDLADALTDTDEIEISEFELNINNNLAEDIVTQASGEYIEEPLRNSKREISLSIVIPWYKADTLRTFYRNKTKLQAKMEFTYGNYQMVFEFPTVIIKSIPVNVEGPEIIPVEVEFEVNRNDGNSYITETEEIKLTIVNDRSTAIWA